MRQQNIMQPDQQRLPLPVWRKTQHHAASPTFDNPVDVRNVLGVNRPVRQEIVVAKSTTHNDDLVFDKQMAKLLERFAKQADFHARSIVIERHTDAVTTLAYIGNQSGDSYLPPGLCVVSLALGRLRRCFRHQVNKFAVDKNHRIGAHRIERMTRQI